MKRRFLLGCMMMSCLSYVCAQSVAFIHEGKELTNGASIEIKGTPPMPVMMCELGVKNLTAAPVTVQIWKEEMNDFAKDPANQSAFCLVVCTNAPYSREFVVQPGEIFNDDGNMHGQFVAGKEGSAIVKYEAFLVDNDEDRVSVTVTYVYTSEQGINDTSLADRFRVVTTPEGVAFVYTGEKECTLQLTDMTGRIVSRFLLQPGQKEYSVALDKGIYVYSLLENGGRSVVKKFVVK